MRAKPRLKLSRQAYNNPTIVSSYGHPSQSGALAA
jgi:hypothetical protein